MAKVKLTQVRSGIGQSQRHRGTLRALGLADRQDERASTSTVRSWLACCARCAIS